MLNSYKWNKLLAMLALLGAFAAPSAFADPVLSIAATPDPAPLGGTVELDVNIADIADLYGYQFSLSFDPTVLQFVGYNEGGFLASAGTTFADGGTVDNATGLISYAFGALFGGVPGASGSGTLAHFSFSVIGGGFTALTFSDVLFLDGADNDIAVQFAPQTLTVSAVPEPSAYLMFGAGLLMVAALRRRSGKAL